MSSIRFNKDEQGVVTLVLDAPDQPVNTMNAAFREDLVAIVDRLEAERENLRGVVLTSAKRTFFAGGDLHSLIAVGPGDARAFFDEVQALKACLRRLERLGRPVVAAINGSALGGGLELALACHARVCLEDASIELGFPEVTLGLMPGAGGTVKLVRLLGLQQALPLLTEARRIPPSRALELGLVDAVASDADRLMALARAWIDAHPDARQPWDDPKHRIPGGTPSSPAVAAMLAVAPAMLQQKTRGNYPAPEAILAAAVEGAQVDFDTAMRIESRYMTRLVVGPVAKNMIGTLFFQANEIRGGRSRPQSAEKRRIARVGVVGAGMMGSGIAWACASKGIDCVLVDVDTAKAQAGKEYSAKLLAERVRKGRSSVEDAERTLARIRPSDSVADLAGCELVIEAVFENRELKAKVTQAIEQVAGEAAIVASNTSTLPITGLAAASSRPQRFVGIHFFSPVERMPLVEIIRGEKTSTDTLAVAWDFVAQLGKTPIVVNDGRGFYTSRVFGTYVNEGMALLGEGVPAALIENAAMQLGMPVGPLAVLDEVSLKLADDVLHQESADDAQSGTHEHREHGRGDHHEHAHEHAHSHDHAHDHAASRGTDARSSRKSRRIPETAVYVLEKMAHGYRRLGRAWGGGFYEYPADGEKFLWPGLQAFERAKRAVTLGDVRDRLLYVQSLETIRCMEEGIVDTSRDANIGSIFGWGFPAWTGGTLRFVDHIGAQRFAERARELARNYGERFAPPALLVRHAESGEPISGAPSSADNAAAA
ncbi:MAG: 3-hydroxyacyl-CoA dehydrogenase NAD-binding domain-containing protein [Burkholderiaceae bacterium]|jgi:3-hydroxyacyl-CoA dehydrogenase/enoyl-CoA hydratase/3-hydroxybutyryl-CoA epimerase|nr:3-hydroxyacyl-CoA dehydrogenase NAD-binding domain-containing protein [Burkholderiaceae bacterium]